jgi:hypothetical protein
MSMPRPKEMGFKVTVTGRTTDGWKVSKEEVSSLATADLEATFHKAVAEMGRIPGASTMASFKVEVKPFHPPARFERSR